MPLQVTKQEYEAYLQALNSYRYAMETYVAEYDDEGENPPAPKPPRPPAFDGFDGE